MRRPLTPLLSAYEKEIGIICDRRKCTRTATRILVIHYMDHCDEAELPPTGDKVYLNCRPCSQDTATRISDKITRMKHTLHPSAQWLECITCGRRIQNVLDICRIKQLPYNT